MVCLLGNFFLTIRIQNITSEDIFLSKKHIQIHLNNEDIPDNNNRTEEIGHKNSQSNYSYIENFDNSDYLDVTETNASGWGENGRIKLGLQLIQHPSIYSRNTTETTRGVFVSGNYAYVADGYSGLAIINITDPTNPGAVTYRDTSDRAENVYVQGNYAYVADRLSGLAIINITDPTNPGEPIYRSTSNSANDVHVQGDFAYVADGYAGLTIINISDPTNPGIPVFKNTGGFSRSVYIQDDYAFLADSNGLVIINISDPTNPGTPIFKNTTGQAQDTFVSRNFVFMASGDSGLAIINISDPNSPGEPVYRSTTVPAYSVQVVGKYAYIATSGRLVIIDVIDPIHPKEPIFISTKRNSQDVYVQGDLAYVADGYEGLTIMRVTKRASLSIAQSRSLYTGNGFIQNVTLNTNQTIFPNTSINHQISSNGNTWIPIDQNKPFNFVINPYHELYWRAILVAEHQHDPTPFIDSIRIDFDVYYDEEAPTITLINVQNNTAIPPNTPIECSIYDFTFSQSWYNWNEDVNLTLSYPWIIISPVSEGYHRLMIYANDSMAHTTFNRFYLYVNNPPTINLLSPSNSSGLLPGTEIKFMISDPLLSNVWFHWDDQENNSLEAPYAIQSINSSGYHTLTVEAYDIWGGITLKKFYFYILTPSTFEIIQHHRSTAYSGEIFIYSLTLINSELITLNLTLKVSGTDEILSGNNTKIELNPGTNRTIELEIRPKHTSTHQLDLYFNHEGSLYYYDILKFHVAPRWMSPTFLLPFVVTLVFLLLIVMVSGTSVLYIRNHLVLYSLFREQESKLTQLIDQLNICILEAKVKKEEEEGFRDLTSRPPGFPQYLQLLEPLDPKTLIQQYTSVHDQIINGDPINLKNLSGLLIQVERLVKELLEDYKIDDRY